MPWWETLAEAGRAAAGATRQTARDMVQSLRGMDAPAAPVTPPATPDPAFLDQLRQATGGQRAQPRPAMTPQQLVQSLGQPAPRPVQAAAAPLPTPPVGFADPQMQAALNQMRAARGQTPAAPSAPNPLQATSVTTKRPRAAPIPGVTPGVSLPPDPAAQRGAQMAASRSMATPQPGAVQPLSPAQRTQMQTIFQDQQRRGILRAGTTFDQFVDTYRRMEARGQPVPDLTPTAPRVTIATPSDWIAAGPSGQVNRNWFDRHIGAKGISDDEFVEKYLGGWWSPRTRLSVGSDGGHISTSLTIKPGMHIFDRNGHIIPEGHDIGTMTRDFNPENRSFYNNYFSLSNHVRGGGIAKWMLKNQYDIYRQMGINHGEVFAALDWGGYVWSKFGFIPERADWRHVQIQATSRLRDLLQDGQIDAATNSAVQRLLLARDPMTLWQISDLTMPVLSRSGERSTLGKELLKGQYWHGTFDLNSNLQMDRFDAYTRDAKSPFTPPSP